MSRRTGLGRGLAALIPPASDRREREQPSDATSGDTTETEPGTTPAATEETAEAATVATGAATGAATGEATAAAADTEAEDRSTASSPGTAAPPAEDEDAGASDDRAATSMQAGASTSTQAVAPTSAPPSSEADAAALATGTTASAADGDPDEGASVRVLPPGIRPEGRQGGAGIAASTATYAEVPPSSIRPNPRQPRDVFDPEELEGLAVSLADIGVLQPLVVRPLGDDAYELIAGERRLRAATLAGLEVVPVLVRHTEDADLLKEALVENIHRVQLNPLEEAAAYEQLLEEFGVTQEELATRLGRSRPAITNALRLLRLPTAVQRRVAAGVLSAGHAKALLTLDDPAAQAKLADRIVAEGLSVRATEELVRLKVLDGDTPSTRRPRSKVTAPGLVELQDDLSDALQARVRITMGARKGKLAIEFASVDDLERIVAVIADGLGHRRTGTTD